MARAVFGRITGEAAAAPSGVWRRPRSTIVGPSAPIGVTGAVDTRTGPTVKARIVELMSDGRMWSPSDIVRGLQTDTTTEAAGSYLRGMTAAGHLERVGYGQYRITDAGRVATYERRTEKVYIQPMQGVRLDVLAHLDGTPSGMTVGALIRATGIQHPVYSAVARLRRRGFVTLDDSGVYAITDAGRVALRDGRAAEARKRAKTPDVAKAPAAPEPAQAPPPPDPTTAILTALRHGSSVRLRGILDVTDLPEVDARRVLTALRQGNMVQRTAPDTWQLTLAGAEHLRGARMPHPGVSPEDDPEDAARSAAVARHVATQGVTRLPGVGSPELAVANEQRGVYRTDVWSPRALQFGKRGR